MRFIYSFLILFSYSPIFAQIQDLIENDSITWIAEWEADYLIDDIDATDTITNNRIYGIKYLNEEEFGLSTLKKAFSYNLWEVVKKNKIKTFSDRDCNKLLTNETALFTGNYRAWFNKETVIDPITYETRCIIHTPLDYVEVMFYRVRQLIYYNVSKAQFQMRVLAIAPLFNSSMNDTIDVSRLEPLFWFKPEMGKPSIHSENITWAQGLTTRENRLFFSKAKNLKNTMADTLVNHFLYSFEKRLDIPFWQINDDSKLEKIENQQRWKILNPVDTIASIEPIHSKEIITITQRHYTINDFKTLRLHQEWFWDNRQNMLFINLKSTSTMVSVNDDNGNFLGFKPLFYRKTDD
jgi:Gliding motility associated protein GldN